MIGNHPALFFYAKELYGILRAIVNSWEDTIFDKSSFLESAHRILLGIMNISYESLFEFMKMLTKKNLDPTELTLELLASTEVESH